MSTLFDMPAPKRVNGQCKICGSTAVSRKVTPPTVILVCPAHVAVCRAHLLDPCPTCDGAA